MTERQLSATLHTDAEWEAGDRMDEIKIVFFDIDGTLIDMERKEITPNTLEALRRLRQRGTLLCLATGRGPRALPRFDGVAFDAFLTFNGSYCYDRTGVAIFSSPIPAQDVRTIIANAAALGRPVSVDTKDRLVANGKDRDLVDYYAIAGLKVDVAPDFDAVAAGEVFQLELGCRKADWPHLLRGTSGAKIAAWWDRAVDVIPAAGGKGVGVRRTLAHFHLDPSQALAFGDGENDLEMFQAVGRSVAMGNASDRMKAAADDVCAHVAEDGIYHYCLAHGLI